MLSLSSFKNLLFKKMLFNYSEYYALFLYFVLCNHKIFLFIQKDQLIWKDVAKFLALLNLNSNYMQVSPSLAKLLFKFGSSFGFFFRELILVFFDDDILIHHLLINDKLLSSVAFLCYNKFFINIKFLEVAGRLLNLFLGNYNCIKTNLNQVIFSFINYIYNILTKVVI
jgi:hypothetical protein